MPTASSFKTLCRTRRRVRHRALPCRRSARSLGMELEGDADVAYRERARAFVNAGRARRGKGAQARRFAQRPSMRSGHEVRHSRGMEGAASYGTLSCAGHGYLVRRKPLPAAGDCAPLRTERPSARRPARLDAPRPRLLRAKPGSPRSAGSCARSTRSSRASSSPPSFRAPASTSRRAWSPRIPEAVYRGQALARVDQGGHRRHRARRDDAVAGRLRSPERGPRPRARAPGPPLHVPQTERRRPGRRARPGTTRRSAATSTAASSSSPIRWARPARR